ncbi:MAG: branched-chain amino acid ABC transporter permease [Proteobacteria bacterium]|nr:branched-chain amino acid ABC transporter permease [Pseudomonadota bacterium]
MHSVSTVPVPLAARDAGQRLRSSLIGLVAVALVTGFAFVGSGYQLFQATMVMVYAIALLGLNILTGYNGQISLGHGAFFAIGAYCAAILMERLSMPYWATLPAAALACGLVGYAVGWPALKLEGIYLALATFALGTATPQLLKFRKLEPLTGGAQGLVLLKPDAPFGLPLNQDQWLYLFVFGVALLMFAIARNLLDGRIGLALLAVRDHPTAATAMGVDVARVKTAAFAVSAAYTGVAGALGAIAVQFVAPDSFTMFLSISLIVGIVAGGLASMSGAVWGAAFIHFIPNVAEKVSKAAPWAIYGVMLIVFVMLLPQGVAGALQRARAAWQRRRRPAGAGHRAGH